MGLVWDESKTDRELAEMIAQFRTPPGFSWADLAADIETVLKSRPRPSTAQEQLEDAEASSPLSGEE